MPPGFGNVAVTKEKREGGEWEARRWRLSPWSLLGKAVSWQQGTFEETARSLRQAGQESGYGGALDIRERRGKRLRAGEKQEARPQRHSGCGAPCHRCACRKWGTAVSDSNNVGTGHRNRMSFLLFPLIPHNCLEIKVPSLSEL